MIMDFENLMSNDQDVWTDGEVISDDFIDLGEDSAKIQQYVERNARIVVRVTTTMDSAADGAFLSTHIQVDDNDGFTSPVVIIGRTGAIEEVDLVAGFVILSIPLPPHISERYMRIRYVVAGESFTSGGITAALVIDDQTSGVMPA